MNKETIDWKMCQTQESVAKCELYLAPTSFTFKQTEELLSFQWLGLHAFTAEGLGSILGWGTKIPQAEWA